MQLFTAILFHLVSSQPNLYNENNNSKVETTEKNGNR
jgi:hypothetical protein